MAAHARQELPRRQVRDFRAQLRRLQVTTTSAVNHYTM